ncbi:MAG: septum formation initiator family protein [Actinomycetota bacterium]|nr:septum formation initiator family protein [Actinomycetota bacterium]
MSSKARIAVASVVFVGFVFGAVFPTRTYLAQRREIAAASERLELFKAQNGRLQSAVDRLQRDDEIERLARSRYNLVRPGEEAYAILPVPAPPPAVPVVVPTKPAQPHPVLAWMRGTLDRVF